MFRVNIFTGDETLKLRVTYQHVEYKGHATILLPSGKRKPISHTTKCLIQHKLRGAWETFIEGAAHCSVLDQFSRFKGRKISLADAMLTVPNRHYRVKFWDAFFPAEGISFNG